MSGKVTFQGVRCTDTRLNLIWEVLLNTLGVTKHIAEFFHGSGYYYDAITIPGGYGLVADQKWLYDKSAALIKAHQNEVVILTAHDDCAARGNYDDFMVNLSKYSASLVEEGIECTTLAFFFEKLNESWSVIPMTSVDVVLNVVCKYRNLDVDTAARKISWLFKNTIPGVE